MGAARECRVGAGTVGLLAGLALGLAGIGALTAPPSASARPATSSEKAAIIAASAKAGNKAVGPSQCWFGWIARVAQSRPTVGSLTMRSDMASIRRLEGLGCGTANGIAVMTRAGATSRTWRQVWDASDEPPPCPFVPTAEIARQLGITYYGLGCP